MIDPDSGFLREERLGGAHRASGDLFTFAVKLKGVARSQMQFLAQGLRNENPSGPVESDLGGNGNR